jgi:hypothetical protein
VSQVQALLGPLFENQVFTYCMFAHAIGFFALKTCLYGSSANFFADF